MLRAIDFPPARPQQEIPARHPIRLSVGINTRRSDIFGKLSIIRRKADPH